VTVRFGALALFGRRPHQTVDGPVMPVSENLDNCCRPRLPSAAAT
jgi:hypothetical protein